ncbi:MAG: c-type cytochrome [Deltaproteobacteria bacterium]|nr:c-type cytochrome [Deltaproteobacteria bacterium]
MAPWAIAALASTIAVLVSACDQHELTEPMVLGGRVVQPEVLNRGREKYVMYCRQCHGDQGDGRGPAAIGLRPVARDFTQGLFKFAAVPAGELPHDADLVRIVRSGLHGTAMLPWDVPDENLDAIIQYIKTFSPRWATGRPGTRISPTPDPFRNRPEAGIARGFNVYHGLAECWSCHAAYGTRSEIFEAYRVMRGAGSADFRDDMYNPVLKDSQYRVNILPPEFLRDPVRSVRNAPAQCWVCHRDEGWGWVERNLRHHELEDYYRIIASGIGGTAMPAWRDSLPEEDIWAMAYYVRSLASMRDTPRAEQLRQRLATQPAFQAPTPPAPAPAPAPAGDTAAPAPDAADGGAPSAEAPDGGAPAAEAPAPSPAAADDAGTAPAPAAEGAGAGDAG